MLFHIERATALLCVFSNVDENDVLVLRVKIVEGDELHNSCCEGEQGGYSCVF